MLTHLGIITTSRCDLKCQHCLRGFPETRQDFPLELLDKLLSEASLFGARHVGLTGGEPHLHPQFEEMVETIVRYGYTWSFVSHGQRTEPYLPIMEKYPEKISHVSLSIDGAKTETHDEIRNREGAFEKVAKAAKIYLEKGFKVKLGMTLNQINKGEVKAFIRLAESLGVKQVGFGGTIPTAWNGHLLLSDAEALALYQEIQKLRKETDLEISIASALYTRGGVNFCSILNLRKLTFNASGKLIFCCDTIETGFVIGSIREYSLKELIQMWLKISATLQTQRAEQITTGNLGEGFDTCSFCNKSLIGPTIAPINAT